MTEQRKLSLTSSNNFKIAAMTRATKQEDLNVGSVAVAESCFLISLLIISTACTVQ